MKLYLGYRLIATGVNLSRIFLVSSLKRSDLRKVFTLNLSKFLKKNLEFG